MTISNEEEISNGCVEVLQAAQNANSLPDHKSCPSYTEKELKSSNDSVSKCNTKLTDRQNYKAYPAEELAQGQLFN